MKSPLLRTFGVLVIAGALALTSCNEPLTIDVGMNVKDVDFTIPNNGQVGPIAATKTLSLNLDSVLTANSVDRDAIAGIYIQQIEFLNTNADSTNNFQQLEEASATISSASNITPSVLGDITSNPDVYSINLDLVCNTSLNLLDYFGDNSFDFAVAGKTRRVLTKDMDVTGTLTFNVELSLDEL